MVLWLGIAFHFLVSGKQMKASKLVCMCTRMHVRVHMFVYNAFSSPELI